MGNQWIDFFFHASLRNDFPDNLQKAPDDFTISVNDEPNLLVMVAWKASEVVSGLFRRVSYGAGSLMSGRYTQWGKGEFRRKARLLLSGKE